VQIPAAVARDTVAAVFGQPAYDRSLRQTLMSRVLAWLGGWLERLRGVASDSPALYWGSIALLVALVLLVVARVTYVAYAGREWREVGGRRVAGPRGRDPWALARELSAAGRFTDAAHALYAALLERLAQREQLRLHPSKTAGDYARDLRARSSPSFPRFREFARAYDVVVYGLGRCDRDRYERLYSLATPMLAPDTPATPADGRAAGRARRAG